MASDTREILIDKMTENLPVLRKKLKLSQENPAKFIGSSKAVKRRISDEKRNIFEAPEYRRWNAYMRSDEYIFSGSKGKSKSRNEFNRRKSDERN